MLRCAQALTYAAVRTRSDVFAGLFCIALIKSAVGEPKRYTPEPIQFLTALLSSLIDVNAADDAESDSEDAIEQFVRPLHPIDSSLLRIVSSEKRNSLSARPIDMQRMVNVLSSPKSKLSAQDK